MKTTVLFDLDGTLLDTLQDLRSAVNHVMREHGFPERTTEETRSFVGNGVGVLISKACPEGTAPEETAQCLSEFRSWYFDHVLEQTVPYEGITEMLTACRKAGLRIGVVSNKFETAVRSLCDKTLPGLIDLAVGDLPDHPRKPDPSNVYRCMEGLGVSDTSEVIYVGDSETDIRTTVNAGIDLITVTWGFREREILLQEGALVHGRIADTPEELTSLILETGMVLRPSADPSC